MPLETTEVLALIDAIPEGYRALVVLAAGSGLRQGEAFGLEIRHVDFLARCVRVEQQLQTLDGRTFITPPKTDASVRTVPLPQVVLDELARHYERVGISASDGTRLIFTNDAVEPIKRSRFGEIWRRAVESAAVPVGTGFHGLRHSYASLLIRHGESVKVVQNRLGHASAAETLDTYSHLWPNSEDRTREALQSVLAPLDASLGRGPDEAQNS